MEPHRFDTGGATAAIFTKMSFVHLHCHSEYSLLDGANRIDDLIRRAQEFEQPALAITDHGNLHAAWEFQEKAKKAGVKPIIGMEAYVAPGDRRSRTAAPRPAPSRTTISCCSRATCRATRTSSSCRRSRTRKASTPSRASTASCSRKYSEGIIVSSACLAGEVAQHLMARIDGRGARGGGVVRRTCSRTATTSRCRRTSPRARRRSTARSSRSAKELGLPVIATNDAHFLKREDHDAHDMLLCIGLGKDRSDADRMRYDRGLYFKSAPEIAEHFADRPDVLENTLKIADERRGRVRQEVPRAGVPAPAGRGDGERAAHARSRPRGRRSATAIRCRPRCSERLDYELGVITKTGYAGYFLIVADFIKAARDRGIPVGPGRGSAAGSLVAYALRITDVCPLKYDLLFERFLNPERVSMPDVDVDFCFERRGEVIEYVRQKYGKESVCQIVTFGTMKSRAAIKDVGRTLGFTPAETDALAKLIPNQPNFSLTVKEAIEQIAEVGKLYRTDERYRQLLDYAIALEGLSRHTGVHAAGVVIAPGPVDDYVPICTQSSKGAGAGDDER